MVIRATDEHVRQWREEGWVLIPELVPRTDIDAALDDLFLVVPTADEYHRGDRRDTLAGTSAVTRNLRRSEPGGRVRFRPEQFLGRVHFPFPGSGALNRLTVHPALLDFVERALGSADLRVYQMSVWAKYTGMADYAQPLHQDHNHSLVPFRAEPGWWHLEGFLYLSDVDEGVAPTQAVSLRDSAGRTQIAPLEPEDAPELYKAARSAAGPKGSYLAYRPDVFHRGVNLTRPDGARFLYNMSYKLGGHDWIGYETAQPTSTVDRFVRFVESCTPRELAVHGVPLPGHPFWTVSMLDQMALRYPRLDLTPWRQALVG